MSHDSVISTGLKLILSAALLTLIMPWPGSSLPADPVALRATLTDLEEGDTKASTSETGADIEPPFLLDSVAVFQFGTEHGSDCWGYVAPDGTPYGIFGVETGLAFVNIETRSVVQVLEGTGCLWQDMASFSHYLYAVSECGTALRVIDLQYLPDSVKVVSAHDISPSGGLLFT